MEGTKLNVVYGSIKGKNETVRYRNSYYEIEVLKYDDKVTYFYCRPLGEGIPNLTLTLDEIGGSFNEVKVKPLDLEVMSLTKAEEVSIAFMIAAETAKEIKNILKF